MPRTIPTTDEGLASGRLTVDLAAIRANWRLLAARAKPGETGAVVKADAYGLGADRVAPVLRAAGCRRFYVAQIEEGATLRSILPDADIVVLAPAMPDALAYARSHNLILTLNDGAALAHWRQDGGAVAANLHVDTGMTRLGLDDMLAPAVWAGLSESERRMVDEVSSHLACADDPEHPANRDQLRRFRLATAELPAEVRRSLANSSGMFLGSDYLQSGQRPGMALYGLNPTPGRANPMRPVVGLEVRILQVRRLDRSATVGYGATATLPAGARFATIGAGYADGLHRSLTNSGSVFVGGQRAPVVGRVSMDLIAIDVSALSDQTLEANRMAEVIGPRQSADDLADAAGTIGYEVLTSLGRRYRRTYLDDGP